MRRHFKAKSTHLRAKSISRTPLSHNAVALAKSARNGMPLGKRSRGGQRNQKVPFVPPEDWHEPTSKEGSGYTVISQYPGDGYRHVLTQNEIQQRLSELPETMLSGLEVVQLSGMTRKKQSFPCYGMQWGCALYLYPIEESLIEHYYQPPSPSQMTESRMYGGRWVQEEPGCWQLIWTEKTIKDFYLNNILIHELGHLLDNRNSSYVDRERYAEWFAIEHGYNRSLARRAAKKVVRRHHSR